MYIPPEMFNMYEQYIQGPTVREGGERDYTTPPPLLSLREHVKKACIF